MEHTLFVIAKPFTTVLALVIAYQAYRGYRRHHAQLRLYVAAGFALIGLGGLLEGVLFEVLQVSIFEAGFVATLVTAAGMLSILYALYAPNPRATFRPNADTETERIRRALHVAEVAQPLHQVLLVLGAAGALSRPLEVLEPRGLLGRLVRGHLAAE